MTDNLDLGLAVGVVFFKAGLVCLIETVALDRFDQGGQFLCYAPSATGVRCKTLEGCEGLQLICQS